MIEVALSPRRIHAGQDTELTVTLTNVDKGTCRNVVFRLNLPRNIVRLAGDGLIKTAKLVPGESVSGSLRVRAEEVGSWEVSSSNFSYRDRRDATVRPGRYVDRLTVVSSMRVEEQPPSFTVDMVDRALPSGEWGTLRIRLANIGDTVVRDVDVSVHGPFRVEGGGLSAPIPTLSPGGSTESSFAVLAGESGAVPVYVDLACRYGQDQLHEQKWTMNVSVGKPLATGLDGVTVLYLSANPLETDRLRVEADLREIREELRRGLVSHLRIEGRGAVRTRDITDALLNIRPRIVHFSGHGAEDGRLYLERDGGHSILVTPRALAALFRQVANDVTCVIVSACSTAALAEAIVEHIDYVIAMRDVLPDRAAIAFSIGFYQALAAGKPVEEAFDFGRTQIHLQLGDGFEDLPVLFRRSPSGGAGVRSS
jgi:hypothetical protein